MQLLQRVNEYLRMKKKTREFFKDYKLQPAVILLAFEKFTRALLFQIALEIM